MPHAFPSFLLLQRRSSFTEEVIVHGDVFHQTGIDKGRAGADPNVQRGNVIHWWKDLSGVLGRGHQRQEDGDTQGHSGTGFVDVDPKGGP